MLATHWRIDLECDRHGKILYIVLIEAISQLEIPTYVDEDLLLQSLIEKQNVKEGEVL